MPEIKKKYLSKKNNLSVIISSPSGAGKTTVTKKLLSLFKNSHLSVSCTTRKKRVGEINGRDYFFLTKQDFFNLRNKKKFIEWAKVHNNFYGTLKNQVLKKKIVFFDVDWQGARVLKKKISGYCYSVFLLPPSIKTLNLRLMKRHKDEPRLAIERFKFAKKDIKHFSEYDYLIVNSNLKECVNSISKKIKEILRDNKIKDHATKTAKKMLNLK